MLFGVVLYTTIDLKSVPVDIGHINVSYEARLERGESRWGTVWC